MFHRNDSDQKKKEQEEKEPFSLKKEIISWIQIIVAAVVIAFVLNTCIIANSYVPTGSMIPTIPLKTRVIGSRLSYLADEPERGDVVIFYYPDDPEQKTFYVKRVIGIPGETVTLKEGKVYINDSETPLEEPYLAEPVNPTEMYNNEDVNNAVYQVPEGCYFMMGDNRNHSLDARFWVNTYVPKDKIIAKVLFSYFPKLKWIE